LGRADVELVARGLAASRSAAQRLIADGAVSRAGGTRIEHSWMETEHRPITVRLAGGGTRPLDALRGLPVLAFAGIGNPAAFRATLTRLAAEVVEFVAFPDHHAYTPADFAQLVSRARRGGAALLVTTLKDLVKVSPGCAEELPVGAVEIAIEPLCGADEVTALIDAAAAGIAASPAGSRP
jgi:tetraacyldisaccharide 4'-kinase